MASTSLSERLANDGRRNLTYVRGAARSAYLGRTWTMLATRRLDHAPVEPEEAVGWLAETLYGRTLDKFDAIVALTGDEGYSKSTLALRLERAITTLSGVPWTWANLCYSAEDLVRAYRVSVPGTVVIFDESVNGLLAGETFTREQMRLVKLLTMARAKRVILLLCVPDIWMLAKKFRGRRVVFWAHVERRGTARNPGPSVAVLHERDRRLRYVPTVGLGLSKSLRCPTVVYGPFAEEDPYWRAYEARKNAALDAALAEPDAEPTGSPLKRRGKRPVGGS